MKIATYLLALLLTAFLGCRSNSSAQSLNALREIKIERRTVLTLGGKMPSVSDFCSWSGETCALKPGTFGGTKEMSLTETEAGLISQFYFYYGVTDIGAVQVQIDDYTRLLGKPSKDSTLRTGELDSRELEWSDSATTFVFSYKTDGKRAEASARLLDNALAGPIH